MESILKHRESDGIVCEDGKFPAGFVLWNGGLIVTIDVLPPFRKKGIGRELLIRACSCMASRGQDLICLEVDCDNLPALCLYESLGFEIKYRFSEHGRYRYYMEKRLDMV